MGLVYRARQLSVNRVVALKMILGGDRASADSVQRFMVEAEATAKLDHPNIIPIYEVGEHEGRRFFAMKFVEGGTLAQRISDCALPISCWKGDLNRTDVRERQRGIAQLIAKLARALAYAHQH